MRAICDASNIGGFVRQLHMCVLTRDSQLTDHRWGFTRFRVGDSEG
jgi:hypothetical protein